MSGAGSARPFDAAGRAASLADLGRDPVDVLVIGGGITGAGVALEAARRGHGVGLVEARDFGAGTSSRSSKLIHGGIRYLAQGEVGLVREALRERSRLRREFPEMVEPISFLLPIPRNLKDAVLLKAGLTTYDLLARGGGFPRHRRIGVEAARRMAPALRRSDIRGAWVYWDAQTDDARLTLAVIRRAAARGALAANHAEVVVTRSVAAGWEVDVRDTLSGARITARCRWLVNAAGVWADSVEALAGRSPRTHLRPSKGVHLTFSRADLPVDTALVFPVGDGRVLFAIPWHGHVVVGTTDTDYGGDIAAPACEPAEAADVLAAVNRFFGLALNPGAVLSRWAGVRPLIATGRQAATKDLSRKPFIEMDERGLLTVTGGKLTTFMAMAEAAVDRLPAPAGAAGGPGVGLAPTREALVAADPALAARLSERHPYTLADIALACDAEMALELDDALNRRLRLAFLDVGAALEAAPAAAAVMAARLGWRDTEARLQGYRELLAREFGAAADRPLPGALLSAGRR
ncbi:MAG TPA: glycerol-3-phosphate dehydrogenase/oxidase [Candidatus Dormibacteraeota bacterium]|jgi:glycerol-3-phosphate dehydrogenase|nr:glycerol-3-phosphate dehydrogenase/oxidase [Candidatus Dormibacteraeota bacterium]